MPPDSPLAEVLIIWTLEAPVLFLLTLYLDQVMGCLVCVCELAHVCASVSARVSRPPSCLCWTLIR